jgi:hypothetical protein
MNLVVVLIDPIKYYLLTFFFCPLKHNSSSTIIYTSSCVCSKYYSNNIEYFQFDHQPT